MLLKSLRFRIVLLLILVGAIPCTLIKAQIIQSYEKKAIEVRMNEIQEQCAFICNQIIQSDFLIDGQSDMVEGELKKLSAIYSGRIMIIDREGEILADTYNLEKGNRLKSDVINDCLNGRGSSFYDEEAQYIEVAVPVVSADETIPGVVLVRTDTDTIVATKEIMDTRSDIVLLFLLSVILIMAYILGTLMVRPFGRITKSIEAVTEGYEDHYLQENAYTETRLISEAFNKMLGRLKAVDDSRQEFVSNVSHELKTPLTSMKVLADSLLAQDDVPVEFYQEFMSDMSAEIERENKIINDLLALVKMDKTATNLNVKTEYMNEVVERILKRLRPIAEQNKVEIVYESFRPVTADVDEMKFALALSNLVENAIKYNKPNGWVHVSLNADHKNFYLEVADSGIGIPEESLEHIFERFYRVDKSHSREIGGTGLGLSIARNVVVMHRGAIKVYSEVGKGTTFVMRIPLNYVV